jgi:hypothetical protein
MDIQTIQLESFNTHLSGAKILYTYPSESPSTVTKFPSWMEWIQKLREPFRKKIRLSNHVFPFSTRSVTSSYDATFQVKDSQDWTLILTYITYSPKPLLVVAEDITIPDGLWQKLNSSTTLIHITSSPIIRLHPYDAIFFTPMDEVSTAYAEYTQRILQAIYRPNYTMKEHKEILQELRIARVGMVWTRYSEKAQNGSMYWYEPVDVQPNEHLHS